MSTTITLKTEQKYFEFILLKQFEEALDFAQNHKIDIYASNNYLFFKILHEDSVSTLPILKQQGFFKRMKSFNVNANDLALQCLSQKSHKCLKWLIDENLLFNPKFIKRNNFEEISKLVKKSIDAKIIALNSSMSLREEALIENSFNQFLNALLPHPSKTLEHNELALTVSRMINDATVKVIMPTNTVFEIKKYGKTMIQYNANSAIKKTDFTSILEASFLSKNIQPSKKIPTSTPFKV